MIRLRLLVLFTLATVMPARAEPALWVARSPTATVYLFGTVHMLKDNIAWRSPRIDHALADSNDLWLELADPFDSKAIGPFVQQNGLDTAHPLSGKLSEAQQMRLQTIMDQAGMPGLAKLEPVRPWLVALMVSMSDVSKAGYDPNQGVEKSLTTTMTVSGRPVHGLETVEEELRYFTHMQPRAELQMLDEAMDDVDAGLARLNTIVRAWQAGDVDGISKLVDQDMAEHEPDAYKALIVDRNVAWAGRLRDRLKGTGISFVAVGAAHLAGPDSVQVQLARFGIEAKRE